MCIRDRPIPSKRINFTKPTVDNGTQLPTDKSDIVINISVTDYNLSEITFNLDGTNYTFYNESLVLYYSFDNNSELGECTNWDCPVYDLSPHKIHGNLSNRSGAGPVESNLPHFITAHCPFGGCVNFSTTDSDANGQSIMINHTEILNPQANDFAMMFWFNCTSALDTDISRKGSTNTHHGLGWYKMEIGGYGEANKLSLQFRTNISPSAGFDVCTLQSNTDFCDGKWHFGLGQRVSGTAELWVDGIQRTDYTVGEGDSTCVGTINNTANLTIGSKDTQDDDFFNGSIDERKFFYHP